MSSQREDGLLIGIFMNPFSVHRNRAPITGTIVSRTHRAAPKNLSMARMFTNVFVGRRNPDVDCRYLVENERLTIGIKTVSGAIVTATQIADAWVNRIVARVSLGETVWRGQEYGLIRFGSQVDTFIPASLVGRIAVGVGQKVKAGETILVESPKARVKPIVRSAGSKDNAALLELARRNPMTMDVTAYTDRSPDYFGLHKALPGSRVFVCDEGQSLPAAACSVLVHRGRFGNQVVPLLYGTDLIHNAQSQSWRSLARVRDAAIEYGMQYSALTYFTVNENNNRMMKLARRDWAFEMAKLEYVDVIPLSVQRLASRYRFYTPGSDAELSRALEYQNAFYLAHQLYEPWSPEEFARYSRTFPGFNRDDILCVERDRKLVGVATTYDPSPLFCVRVLEYDRSARWAAAVVRWIHRTSGLLFEPPRKGEAIPTRHLRRFAAAEPEAAEQLFRYVCNTALARGARSVCFVHDPRTPIVARQPLVFRYPLLVFGTKQTLSGASWDGTQPVYFDVTLS
jgi:phosphatidylserine decarboxylase precursor-related protein